MLLPGRKNITCLILFTVAFFAAEAQQAIFSKDVRKQLKRVYEDSTGPNGNYFGHSIVGFGFTLPVNENDSAAITDNAQSNQFYYGMREKIKFSEVFALNVDVFYMHQKFKIQQSDSMNVFSPGLRNDVQKLNLNTIGLGTNIRINYRQRGNILGKYIDLGGDAHYVFANRLFSRNDVDAATHGGSERIKTSFTKLDYVSRIQFYATARFGFNQAAFFARYRVSDMFVKSDHFYPGGKVPELSRITIGIEFAIYE